METLEKGHGVHIMGEIGPRSDPDIMDLHNVIWDNFNFPMLYSHRQWCKYGPHLCIIEMSSSMEHFRQVITLPLREMSAKQCTFYQRLSSSHNSIILLQQCHSFFFNPPEQFAQWVHMHCFLCIFMSGLYQKSLKNIRCMPLSAGK